MTDKHAITLIETCVAQYKRLNAAFDAIDKVFSVANTEIYEAAWGAFDKYVEAVSELIGDDSEWIDWFIYEAKCGEKDLKYRASAKSRPVQIKTAKQLLWIIKSK